MEKDTQVTRTFIHNIFEFLKASDFYFVSEEIDIAKGKYQLPENMKELKNYYKRRKKYPKDGNN